MALEQRMDGLNKAIDVQSEEGNWNRNAYMHGVLNGMLIARGILIGQRPQTHAQLAEYLEDIAAIEEMKSKRGPGRPPGAKNFPKVESKVEPVAAMPGVTKEYNYEDEMKAIDPTYQVLSDNEI